MGAGENTTPCFLREATVADARTLAEIHVEGWRWGFRGLLPDRVIAARDVARREQEYVVGFTEDWRDGDACFIAEDVDGTALGFVTCGPAADQHATPPPHAGEVYSIYVRQAAQGKGVGRMLLDRATKALREHGFGVAVLWVIASNDRARRFYEAAGWSFDGTRTEHSYDDAPRTLVRYVTM
jgi:ribosomal protein S18 acetylase RimI-like enzyme